MVSVRKDLRLHNRNNTILGDIIKNRFNVIYFFDMFYIDTLPILNWDWGMLFKKPKGIYL